MASAFGADTAFIGWIDQERAGDFEAEFGNDPEWIAAYQAKYVGDILLPHLMALQESGNAPRCARGSRRRRCAESIFYREYLAPQGIIDNLAAILIKRPGFSAHLALLRKSPALPFRPAECARMQTLMPHLTRAIFIQGRLLRDAGIAQGYRARTPPAFSGYVLRLSDDRRVVEIDAGLARVVGLQVAAALRGTRFAEAVAAAVDRQPCAAEVLDEAGAPVRLFCEGGGRRAIGRFSDLVAGPGRGLCRSRHADRSAAPDRVSGDRRALWPDSMEARVLRDAVEHGDLTGIGERLGMARATMRASPPYLCQDRQRLCRIGQLAAHRSRQAKR